MRMCCACMQICICVYVGMQSHVQVCVSTHEYAMHECKHASLPPYVILPPCAMSLGHQTSPTWPHTQDLYWGYNLLRFDEIATLHCCEYPPGHTADECASADLPQTRPQPPGQHAVHCSPVLGFSGPHPQAPEETPGMRRALSGAGPAGLTNPVWLGPLSYISR